MMAHRPSPANPAAGTHAEPPPLAAAHRAGRRDQGLETLIAGQVRHRRPRSRRMRGRHMNYRRLGKSGLQVSELSLGSWVTFGKQVDQKDAIAIMKRAYEAGINFFDNAEGYEAGVSEALMGEALANLGWSRDSYIVSSKVFWGGSKPTQRGLSRKHVTDACHAALKRLQVEYLDLFFCHRPDIDTPIEETVRAMHDLVAQGKVLYWGTSEWTAQQITEAWGVARSMNLTPPTMEQPQYNIFERHKVEGDYLPLYDLVGLGTTIWSPLASGVLTGKYSKGIPDDSRLNLPGYEWLKEIWQSEGGKAKLAKVDELAALAREIGISMTHLALLWCLANPHVSTVILGASKLSQLDDNLAALDNRDKVTPEVMARIDEIVGNKPAAPQRY
jgi:voltage-dependent potassium channel beta subunit